jgi:hypothetical protein
MFYYVDDNSWGIHQITTTIRIKRIITRRPHFLSPRLNSLLFLDVLENNLFNYLDDVPLATRQELWLQMNSAPVHYGLNVREWCNRNFPRRWICRLGNEFNNELEAGRGPTAWPPRSPDLNVLDFFVWGYLKDLVYATPVQTRDDLILRIQEACENLRNNPDMISSSVNSLLRRCQKCIEVNGMQELVAILNSISSNVLLLLLLFLLCVVCMRVSMLLYVWCNLL